MHIIGNVTIYLALILAIYAFLVLVLGIKKQNQRLIDSGKGATLSIFILASISVALMLALLGTGQFQFEFVYQYTSTDLPLIYKLTALWAGNAGSLLLWTFLLTLFSVIILYSKKLKETPMIPYVLVFLMLNIIFFYLIVGFVTNPFTLLDEVPVEGRGLNPMLQDPGMIIHPVLIYLGYVGLTVPFSFAMASLILRNTDSYWIQITRRWTMFAWLFLTLGNVIGGYWAYTELGWGGYWAWDPVENASFMPWLTVTAFLHSVMIQERKKMLKAWNYSLIIISYGLALFGTFLVRSGILTSVHAFAESNLGTYFLIFMATMIFISLYILMNRYQLIQKESGQIEAFISKESSFLINNLILVGGTFAVFWGTIFPLVSEAITGNKVTVGIPFFNTVMSPIMLSLLLLIAICPVISWQRSSAKSLLKDFLIPAVISVVIFVLLFLFGIRDAYPIISFTIIAFLILTHIAEFIRGTKARQKATNESLIVAFFRMIVRSRRRHGGYIVHIGIAIIAFGIVGSNFDIERLETLAEGESMTIGDYVLTYEKLSQDIEGRKKTVFANIAVEKNGKHVGYIRPERAIFPNWDEPSTEVAVRSTLKEDLYVVLNGWEEDRRATLQVKINPLVKWIWIGSAVVVFGTIFAIWGGRYGQVAPKYTGTVRKVY